MFRSVPPTYAIKKKLTISYKKYTAFPLASQQKTAAEINLLHLLSIKKELKMSASVYVRSHKPHNWGTKSQTSIVHYINRFVHLDKKSSNQSTFRQVNIAILYKASELFM